jgi:nucleoside-diphosphate-sugar epimerase
VDVLILGCGFTGQRVAERFAAKGARVTVTTRDPQHLAGLGVNVITLREVPAHTRKGMLVLHSIPPEGSAGIVELLGKAPARVVYLSSTAVYGSAAVVNETSFVDPSNERARLRILDEERVAQGPWTSLILRPAAIYGPGRGAQEAVRRGTYVANENFVSRIHVDDLATHVEAGLLSNVCGAYPVADDEPATTREVGEFCARLLGLPDVPADVTAQTAPTRTMGNRRVDGSGIRRLLGITLAFSSYRVGIPAALGLSPLTGS